MAEEYERKYRADEPRQAAIARAFPGPWEEIPMATTYYDTPDGALSCRRWTLRHRMEGSRAVCTLKTPGQNQARGEWEVDCDCIDRALEPLSRAAHCPELLQLTCMGLEAVCGARFTRQAMLLVQPEFTAELALDSGVLCKGNLQCPLCEIELELKSGSREAMDAFAAEFAAQYDLVPEPRSKYARARSLDQER